ncbi:4091_t:CDS:1 [Paraglomus occultum]|uniref:4091_t:CDS:1 n=1 Tax=Paraglomus occultum TaxID=144539 RepID=A0A9N9FAA7_9GLOM|nr:4091_t:CDS:1 [Paraglomus occultum]
MNSNPINEEPILRQVYSHTELCTATHSTCPATCFINNLTQNEQKLLHNPPYTLATSYDSILNPIRRRRNNSNKRNLPPRPQNGWILFRRNFQSQVLSGSPGKSSALNEISQKAAKSWKNQPKEVKEYFKVLSKLASYKHKAMYPEYVYNPRKFKNGDSFIFKYMDKDKFVKNGSSNASTSKKAKKSNNLSEGDHIGVMRNEDYSEINDEQQSILPSTFLDFPNLFSDFSDFSMFSPNYSPFFYQCEFYNDIRNDNIIAAEPINYADYGFESYSA